MQFAHKISILLTQGKGVFGLFLMWFLGTALISYLMLFAYLVTKGFLMKDAMTVLWQALQSAPDWMPVIVCSLPFLLYVMIKSLQKIFRTKSTSQTFGQLSLVLVMPMVGMWLISFLHPDGLHSKGIKLDRNNTVEKISKALSLNLKKNKIRGVHFFARAREGIVDLDPLVINNVDHIVLVPYAYQSTFDDPDLRFDGRRRNARMRRDSLYQVLNRQANERGMYTIVKPHIWMQTNQKEWRSDISFESDDDWQIWSTNYRKFIMHYAALSEKMQSPYFCIGTELTAMTKTRPAFWKELIAEVRTIYHGKIFYAANWYQEYEHISFWSDLDVIGIQSYFPVSKRHAPTVEELCKTWEPLRKKLRKISSRYQRPLIFSEMGYKSTSDAAIAPWEWVDGSAGQSKELSTQTQANCYEAFFRTFWDQPWFAGTLVWQWRGNHARAGGPSDINFTPQNKPAQDIMAKWFAK